MTEQKALCVRLLLCRLLRSCLPCRDGRTVDSPGKRLGSTCPTEGDGGAEAVLQHTSAKKTRKSWKIAQHIEKISVL